MRKKKATEIWVAKNCKFDKNSAREIPMSSTLEFKDLDRSGLLTEAYDPKIKDVHPFLRPTIGGQVPQYIRWMYNPMTGEMLVDSGSGMHAEQLDKYRRKLKEKGADTNEFEAWLRGFYVPKTGQLAMRPYWPRDDYDAYDDAHMEINRRIQEHVRNLLQAQMKDAKLDAVHDIDNDWLRNNLGGQRW